MDEQVALSILSYLSEGLELATAESWPGRGGRRIRPEDRQFESPLFQQ